VQSGKGSGKYVSDINVTPLVDVMLVLLVIFMVTAPMMFSGINLDLPRTKKVNSINLSAEQVVLSITKTNEYYLGKDKVLFGEIVNFVKDKFEKTSVDTLFIRADYALKYGNIAYLMAHLKKSGISKIALVTEPIEKE